jgi:hypothetical protein
MRRLLQVRTLIYSPYLKCTTNDLTQARRTVHELREKYSPVNGGRPADLVDVSQGTPSGPTACLPQP